ncbi:hypothetical protein PLICRDRAFT_48701 [Plicaturopsis crispa FD-325 SS-3]|nr:hypothetical protein PLICRDRAFT_48701 [Plicaturopsis crispa FD-325 SS-3]
MSRPLFADSAAIAANSNVLNNNKYKRTRSQLNIPDFDYPLARSPLKDARTALRNRQPEPLPRDALDMVADDSEDEILLSPKKNTKKRPSSPIEPDRDSLPASPSAERQAKRAKRETPPTEDTENRRPPSSKRKNASSRTASASTSRNPFTIAAGLATPSRNRAQSVPPPAGSPNRVPRLDLTSPMRSPSKTHEPKLRFVSVPPVEAKAAEPAPVPFAPGPSTPESGPTVTVSTPGESTHPVRSPTPEARSSVQPMVLKTPRNKSTALGVFGTPMSPLTPLPPTPFPPRSDQMRMVEAPPLPRMGEPSRLPRPSSALMLPPSTIPVHARSDAQTNTAKDFGKTPAKDAPGNAAAGVPTRVSKPKLKTKAPTRVTRSASQRLKQNTTGAPPPGQKKLSSFAFSFAAPTSSSAGKMKEKAAASTSKSRPSSPYKAGSPSKPRLSSPSKPHPSSPTKPRLSSPARPTLGRSSTVFRFGGSSAHPRPPSSLSSLSMALEKLNLPPPARPDTRHARPDTSLGFREGAEEEGEGKRGKDDIGMGVGKLNGGTGKVTNGGGMGMGIGLGRPSTGLARASTLPSIRAPPPPSSADDAGSSSSSTATTGRAPFAFGPGARPSTGRMNLASRKPPLPSVAGSPVKGKGNGKGKGTDTEDDPLPSEEEPLPTEEEPLPSSDLTIDVPSDSEDVGVTEKGKGKAAEYSRRASLASYAVSQSLGSIPRAASSSYPADGGMRSADGGLGMRSAPGALGGRVRSGAGGHVARAVSSADGGGVSGVLKECTIFVDVRTERGDDAGGLFVDMLKGMGAKILGRAGQTCTHIVYKNGLVSTLTRYRLLHEPRPLVVGIAWVVECVEQRTRVDEAKFRVDLDGVNVAGVNKRRRSMVPKSLDSPGKEQGDVSMRTVGDQSMDGSSSSTILDSEELAVLRKEREEWEALPPLERARRKRQMGSSK